MWARLKTAFTLLLWLRQFAKEVEVNAQVRLGQERALSDRKALEGLALDLIEGKGNHWAHRLFRLIGLNDEAGTYLQSLLKSEKLAQATNGDPSEQAKVKVSLAKARSMFSGYHQP